MKRIVHFSLLLLAGTLLQRAQAVPFTNYLDSTSNAVAEAVATAPTGRARIQLNLAMGDLRKVSTSVAGDYRIFSAIVAHLRPLAGQPATELIDITLTNAFTNFMAEAQAEILALSNGVFVLTPFQPLKRQASNQLARAQRGLDSATNTLSQHDVGSLALAYGKIVLAGHLLAAAQRHPGLAPDSLVGKTTLMHPQRGSTRTTQFIDDTNCLEDKYEGVMSSYSWTRTGMNTGHLHLQNPDGQTELSVRFTTAHRGTLTYRHTGSRHESGSGWFTIN